MEYVAVSIKKGRFEFSIIYFYLPPNASFSSSQIKNVLNDIPTPFHILEDSNAYNLAWVVKKI